MMHNYLRGLGRDNRVVLHTHPTDLIGMTHCKPFLDSDVITRTLWSMIPETKAFCPRGLGIIPYKLPSSVELAEATIKELQDYDVVMWEKHGVFAVDCDAMQAFDQIDVLKGGICNSRLGSMGQSQLLAVSRSQVLNSSKDLLCLRGSNLLLGAHLLCQSTQMHQSLSLIHI